MTTPSACFRTPVTGWMRKRGLAKGWATVSLEGSAIVLTGEAGGRAVIRFMEIGKFRPGNFETKSRTYWSTWIWPREGGRRYELSGDHDLNNYAQFVREAATRMLLSGQAIQVETGSGYFFAAYVLTAFGLLSVVMLTLVWWFWKTGDSDWYMMFIPAAVPVSVFVVALIGSHARYLPRRVDSPVEIGRGLPRWPRGGI